MAKYLDFLTINTGDLIFTLINTLILFTVLRFLLFKRVNKILDDRKADVDSTYKVADDAMANAKALEENYTNLLANAREESAEIIKSATKKAQVRSDEIVESAREEASRLIVKANDDIEREKKRAKTQIKDEISDLAVLVAQKVIEKEISKDDNEKLINDFIENVGEMR